MVRISFTGDVMCEHTRLDSYYCPGKDSYDFSPVFEGLKHVTDKSDCTVVNLETPLAGKEMRYSWRDYQFNTPDEIADALVGAGVDTAVTANNHALDRGMEGLVRTTDVLDQKGILHTGTFKRPEENRPLILERKGLRIALLSYTYGTEACYNGHYLKKEDRLCVNLTRNQELSNPFLRFILRSRSIPAKGIRFGLRLTAPGFLAIPVEERKEADKEQLEHMVSDIAWCKERADYVVMCLHCGGQFHKEPTEYTKRIINLCFRKGADAVICNHEHLIQGIRQRKDGRIATYCLGNYTSNYGIDRAPFDLNADCSVVFHIDLDHRENGPVAGYSFSIMRSVKNSDGRIVTVPMSQLYREAETEEEREALTAVNTWCVNRFLGQSFERVIPHKEYSTDFKP